MEEYWEGVKWGCFALQGPTVGNASLVFWEICGHLLETQENLQSLGDLVFELGFLREDGDEWLWNFHQIYLAAPAYYENLLS